MCADLHQYRPVNANKGGLTGKVDIGLEMGPVAHLWLTYGPLSQHRKTPQACKCLQGILLPKCPQLDSNQRPTA